ncbi:MAG: CBS domain-containing protein, partial [Proteobacteria bacterium]|nr:CBS domain-containing protein [Pseudomonadota bacterium]
MGHIEKKELIGNEGMVLLDMIRRLNRRKATDNILKLIVKTHPADMAWVFRHLSEPERLEVFNILAQTDQVGEFLSELDESIMVALVETLTAKFMADVLSKMASNNAVDLIEALPVEFAAEIRKHMEKADREEVDELLQYHPETAGGIMSPDFMYLNEELSVGEAIAKVQKRSEEKKMVFYLYITFGDGKLAGVVSLRELLTNPPHRQLKN